MVFLVSPGASLGRVLLLYEQLYRHFAAGLGFEDFVDGLAELILVGIGLLVGNVHQPVGVPNGLEFVSVDVFGAVVAGDDFAHVIDNCLVQMELGHDLAGDRRAFDFLILAGTGAVEFFCFLNADVVKNRRRLDNEGVAAFCVLDFIGVLEDGEGMVDAFVVVAEERLHSAGQLFADRLICVGNHSAQALGAVLAPLCTPEVNVGIAHLFGAGLAFAGGLVLPELNLRTASGTSYLEDVSGLPESLVLTWALNHIRPQTNEFQRIGGPSPAFHRFIRPSLAFCADTTATLYQE